MMDEPRHLSTVLAELASMSADFCDVAELVHHACDRACELLACDGAIVLLSLDGVALEPAGSSGHVGDIRALLANERVPCRAAMHTGEVVHFADDEADERFPDYSALAADAGIRRVLSVPFGHGGDVFGTLSMVRRTATDFALDEIEAARRLGEVTAAGIVRDKALQAARAVSEQLKHALDARVVVEQAKGMVAAELQTSVDGALDLIRRFARRQHLRLADVAGDIVARELPTMLLKHR